MKAFFIITESGDILPYSDETFDYIQRRKAGTIISAEIKQSRNYKFHRKMMALFKAVNDNLPEPEPIEYKGKMIQPVNNFDTTRKYLTIMAGYSDLIVFPNGKVRAEAQSLAYDNMDAETFEKLYSAVIDAALRLMGDKWTGAELERVTDEIMRFA